MTNNVKVFVFYFWLSFATVKNLNFVDGVNNAIKPIYSPNPKIPFLNFCCKKGIFYDRIQDNCSYNIIINQSHHAKNNAQLEKQIVKLIDAESIVNMIENIRVQALAQVVRIINQQ